jgi:CRP/FNR family transcriptional regulator, cyclic AMP receptor protein
MAAMLTRAQLIDASPLFTGISAESRRRLEESLVQRRFDKDAVVYLRGDEAVAFYGIAEGRVRFSAGSPEGREVVLNYAGAGEWFGEIGLFDDLPRIVDAIVSEPTTLQVLAARDLLSMCRSDNALLFHFVELFSRRMRMAESVVMDAAFLSLPERLAKKLLMLALDESCSEATPRGPAVRMSQDELGRLTGVTRESAGRQLKLWEREGIVVLDYGRVVIVDPARLRRLVAAVIGD